MIAAYGAGWYPSISEAATQMAGATTVVEPNLQMHEKYAQLLEIYRKMYHATADLNREMLAFTAQQNHTP